MKKFLLAMASTALAITANAAAVPTYPGGEEAMKAYFAENMKYPEMAKENGIEGVIPLSVQIKSDGSVGTIKIVRMLDPDLEQEAIRLVKNMPKWTPADKNGTPVDATADISILFEIPGE